MRWPKHHRFVRTFAMAVGFSLTGLVAINLVIDPYGAYRLVSIPSFETYRDEQYVAVAERFRHSRAKTVVVGSSRVVDGIDPAMCDQTGPPICPVAVRGTAWKEQRDILKHLIDHPQGPQQVVFALDLDTVFRKSRPSDFEQSRFSSSLRTIDYHSQNLLSLHSLKQSLDLISHALSTTPRIDDQIEQRVQQKGSYQVFRSQLSRQIDMHQPATTVQRIHDSVVELEQLMADAERQKISFKIVFLPIHALSYEKLNRQGYGECLETLKRRVTNICSIHKVPLWDFTGYTEFTTECVPKPEQRDEVMHWFYDSDHFTPELGKQVMSCISQNIRSVPAETRRNLDALGTRLTAENIESHLESLRQQRVRYLSESPAELRLLDPNNPLQAFADHRPTESVNRYVQR
ncbi:hypothetical protein [Planctomycetes bacterium K23_9]|uniref:Uncharacterized protein n=1 Tax=Stieleria marina TaxID=1930275 RepID=A0A517NNR6_9BACT|nr:hypothetical protein K239x_07170 [Planctomycetes bacterium K23_9]